jgi:hypothetical protein
MATSTLVHIHKLRIDLILREANTKQKVAEHRWKKI